MCTIVKHHQKEHNAIKKNQIEQIDKMETKNQKIQEKKDVITKYKNIHDDDKNEANNIYLEKDNSWNNVFYNEKNDDFESTLI